MAMQSLAQLEVLSAVPVNGLTEQTPSPQTGELQSFGQLAAFSAVYPGKGVVVHMPSPQVGLQSTLQLLTFSAFEAYAGAGEVAQTPSPQVGLQSLGQEVASDPGAVAHTPSPQTAAKNS